jgi:hypothetical protein
MEVLEDLDPALRRFLLRKWSFVHHTQELGRVMPQLRSKMDRLLEVWRLDPSTA